MYVSDYDSGFATGSYGDYGGNGFVCILRNNMSAKYINLN